MMEGKRFLKLKIADTQGKLLPMGAREELSVEIVDGSMTFWLKNPQFTRRWVVLSRALERETADNKSETSYLEREQKGISRYPGLNAEEIETKLLAAFKGGGFKIERRKSDN